MNKRQFAALETLRERVENRARKELEAARERQSLSRQVAEQAKEKVETEVTMRSAFVERWSGKGVVPSSAAEQISVRACLVQMDGQIQQSMQEAVEAGTALLMAVKDTNESSERFRMARVATEKSRYGTARHKEVMTKLQLNAEETLSDEETEVQTIASFIARANSAGAR